MDIVTASADEVVIPNQSIEISIGQVNAALDVVSSSGGRVVATVIDDILYAVKGIVITAGDGVQGSVYGIDIASDLIAATNQTVKVSNNIIVVSDHTVAGANEGVDRADGCVIISLYLIVISIE